MVGAKLQVEGEPQLAEVLGLESDSLRDHAAREKPGQK